MDRPVPRPSNRWIRAERDRRWPMAFAVLALLSVALVGALALIGWPRLRALTLHYEIAGLRTEVETLERQVDEAEGQVQALTAPEALETAALATGLGVPTPPQAEAVEDGP